MSLTHLLVVADDPFARSGLAHLVDELPGCMVIDQLSTGEATTVSLESDFDQIPDVLVWDVGWESSSLLPDWEGLALPIVALLPDAEDAAAVWASGVRALLPRATSADRLGAAIEAVNQGLVVLDAAFLGHMLAASPEKPDESLPSNLTPRESQVLQLLAEGVTNRAIAQRLSISDHTVKFHVNAIMSKLGAQSRTEAVVRATRLGLILL